MEQTDTNQMSAPVMPAKKRSNSMLYFALFLLCAVIFTSVGFGIGYFAFNDSSNGNKDTSSEQSESQETEGETTEDEDTTNDTDSTAEEKSLTYTNSKYPALSIKYPKSWTKKEGTDFVSFSKKDYVLKYTFGQEASTADGGHADCYESSEVIYEKVNDNLTRVSKFKTTQYSDSVYHFGKIYEVSSQLAEIQTKFSAYTFSKPFSSYKMCAYDFPSGIILTTNSDLYSSVKIEVSYDSKGELLTEADEIVSNTVYN